MKMLICQSFLRRLCQFNVHFKWWYFNWLLTKMTRDILNCIALNIVESTMWRQIGQLLALPLVVNNWHKFSSYSSFPKHLNILLCVSKWSERENQRNRRFDHLTMFVMESISRWVRNITKEKQGVCEECHRRPCSLCPHKYFISRMNDRFFLSPHSSSLAFFCSSANYADQSDRSIAPFSN